MKNLIQKVPIPLSGVMLGIIALGNLLQQYAEDLRIICGLIGIVLFLMLTAKLVLYPGMIRDDVKNPIMASVAATYPMSIMQLSVFLQPAIGKAGLYIWYFAIVLHIAIILLFTKQFIFNFKMKKVYASYFIVYVGIVVSTITAPVYNKEMIGQAAFWFGFINLIILLCLVGYRYAKHKNIPEESQPVFCIFAAPANLCLVGYLQIAENKSIFIISFLGILSCILYSFAFVKMLDCLKRKFYPSYASFTFPFVISATAVTQVVDYLKASGIKIRFFEYVSLAETFIAIVLVSYVLVCYLIYFLSNGKVNHKKDMLTKSPI